MNYFLRHKVFSACLAVSLALTTSNFACNTNYLQAIQEYLPQVLSILSAIAPLVGLFAASVSPADAAAAKKITDEAAADAKLLEKVYSEYQAAPNKTTRIAIENALAAVLNNLPALLKASHIENQKMLTALTSAIGIAVALSDTLLAGMPDPTPEVKRAQSEVKQSGLKPRMVSTTSVKRQWDDVVCLGDEACSALVK